MAEPRLYAEGVIVNMIWATMNSFLRGSGE